MFGHVGDTQAVFGQRGAARSRDAADLGLYAVQTRRIAQHGLAAAHAVAGRHDPHRPQRGERIGIPEPVHRGAAADNAIRFLRAPAVGRSAAELFQRIGRQEPRSGPALGGAGDTVAGGADQTDPVQADMTPDIPTERAIDRAAAQTDGDQVTPRFQHVCRHGDLESPNARGEAGLRGGHGRRLGLGPVQSSRRRQRGCAIRVHIGFQGIVQTGRQLRQRALRHPTAPHLSSVDPHHGAAEVFYLQMQVLRLARVGHAEPGS